MNTFNTKTAFSDLSPVSSTENWTKCIWYGQCIPRHSFNLWVAYQGRLITHDRLKKWDRDKTFKCAFCNCQGDSHEHLFFDCLYPSKVWENLKECAMLQNCPKNLVGCVDLLAAIGKIKSIKSIIQRLMLGAMVYFIWQERNLRLFQGKQRSVEELCKQIKETVRLKLIGMKVKASPTAVKLSKDWGFMLHFKAPKDQKVQ
jgi:hypothetical protein